MIMTQDQIEVFEGSESENSAITEAEIIKLMAKHWLLAKDADPAHAEAYSDPMELALLSPEDYEACSQVAQALLARLEPPQKAIGIYNELMAIARGDNDVAQQRLDEFARYARGERTPSPPQSDAKRLRELSENVVHLALQLCGVLEIEHGPFSEESLLGSARAACNILRTFLRNHPTEAEGWRSIGTRPADTAAYPIQVCGGSFRGTSVAWSYDDVADATFWHPMAVARPGA